MSEEHPGTGGSTGKAEMDFMGEREELTGRWLGFGAGWRPEATEEAGTW